MNGTSSEEQLLEFLYACPVGLIECDRAGEIAMMNPHAMQHLLPLAGPRDSSNLFKALEEHAPELRSIVADYGPATGKICDGHRIFVDLGPGRRAQAPKVLGCTVMKLGVDRLMVTLADISEQVVQEERLRQADSWFATLVDGTNEYAALTITADGLITSANACFTRQTGYDCAAVTGRNLADVLDTDPAGAALRLSEQVKIAGRDGWHLQEGWQRRADGGRYWCQRLVVARSDHADDPRPSGFSVILRDVPGREGAAEDMRRLLTCDHLTGASNRRHFSQIMEREQTHWREVRQPLSLILLDLDHFKTVNDTHGHPVGDILLRRVAEVCTMLLPPRGVFARLGGEEFGALLPRRDNDQAIGLAEAMRTAIGAIEVDMPRGPLTVSASLGCATLDEAGGSIDALIALADERLYAAKRAGRNRVYRSDAHAA
ncbi:PAS domain S-box-containing protein/diguanylate cyclase (GGDEF)-like protein [Sphingomonas aurantiaca]|jgi:diguanylate cyclase (GGDEF)-like protein/PAS domain S-box-containing protein|uniref:diguanylate cyclase n=1 Tax=Sphingomonas aurantiaca TaxID=185949 RepID=A0A2T5GIX2_9SPHN|nr:sensor domain-containing diguanylate cyclase [Sphingomonas aurantiaca]PTQ59263.1 PAS domain S-box-containing protein/diguanylate cyclase (GGDEF)-like protein [Sphingomonas aurantiaca]